MNYLAEERAMNLFIIGDLENFGYKAPFQDIWAEFDNEGNIQGILFRYYDNYIPYTKNHYNYEAFANIIKQQDNIHMVSGQTKLAAQLARKIDYTIQSERTTFFAELKEVLPLPFPAANMPPIREAQEEDIPRIRKLHEQVEEFNSNFNEDSFRYAFQTNSGKTVYIENEQKEMNAVASTTAENSYATMIVGVATKESERGKGLASLLMHYLCKEIVAKNKTACLFYDNEHAGRIYNRIGFEDIGRWSMITVA